MPIYNPASIASQIVNTPAGAIVATTVQAAINELDTEKLPLAGGTMTGNIALNGYQITNQVIHTVANAAARAALTAAAGKLVYQTDTARPYIYG